MSEAIFIPALGRFQRPTKKPNSFRIDGDVAWIILQNGMETCVDVDDLPQVILHRWRAYQGRWHERHIVTIWYARCDGIGLHRFILGMTKGDGLEADHKDRDGLNNLRSNLRVATKQQNHFNEAKRRNMTSRFKGVSYCGEGRKNWRAQIFISGRSISLGRYFTPEEAAAAYNAAAKELQGEFALINALP